MIFCKEAVAQKRIGGARTVPHAVVVAEHAPVSRDAREGPAPGTVVLHEAVLHETGPVVQSKHGAARVVVGSGAVRDVRTPAAQREALDSRTCEQRHAPRRVRPDAMVRKARLERSHRRVAAGTLIARKRRRGALNYGLVPRPVGDERHATRHHHARLDPQRLRRVVSLRRQRLAHVVHARQRMDDVARDRKRGRRRERLLRRRRRPPVVGVVSVHGVHVPVRRTHGPHLHRRHVLRARHRPVEHAFLIFSADGDAKQVALGG